MGRRILVCDDEPSLREMLAVLLGRVGHDVTRADGVASARTAIAGSAPFDAVITDLVMPDGSGMDVLDAALARDDTTQVLMITAFATTEQAVEAMRRGAYDYVQKPFRNHELLATLDKALEKRAIVAENALLRAQIRAGFEQGGILGASPAIERVRDLVRRAAASPASVLITGESGTGKEVVARALHELGERCAGPFVAIHCGALPENLMESELFGHERGAFTGATEKKVGLFRAAEGGTVFLDEIGELAPALQVKLLRVLQERRVRSVGGRDEVPVDARVVAATNRDVETDVGSGAFRQDLFYRLNVVRIHLPPLRERPEDVPLLATHFLAKHGAALGRRLELAPGAIARLTAFRYPGNVRELENLVERAVALAEGPTIEADDFPLPDAAPLREEPSLGPVSLAPGFDLDAYLGAIERRLLEQALREAGGVRTKAAELLGMSFRQLRYRLLKHGGLGD